VKQIVGKFKIIKPKVYDILKSKSDTKRVWLTGDGSMKRKLKKTGNEDINESVWHWFVSAIKIAYLVQCCDRKQNKWLIN
jgi:hypothetical protein